MTTTASQANEPGPVSVSQAELIRLSVAARSLQLDALRIGSRKGGDYLSHYKGRGMEFDEARPYQHGDDPRNIDWRVTARTGKPFTKLFREERERPVLVWLDLSAPMRFASTGSFKWVLAARAASILAWAAIQRGDRFGALLFAEQFHRELRPRLGRRSVLRFIHEVCQFDTQGDRAAAGDADMSKAIARLHRVALPGSLVVMFSDFCQVNDSIGRQFSDLGRHSDVLMVHISDPLERELPPPGRYAVRAAKAELTISTASTTVRSDFREHFLQRQALLRELCRKNGINYQSVSTDQEPLGALQTMFARRGR